MAPFENWDKLDDDDEEELQDDTWIQGRKDAVLFAIDCSESMLELRDDGHGNLRSHLQTALEGCRDLQKRKAHVGPNDSAGILVFNTAEKVDSQGGQSGEIKNHCHAFQPVQQVNAPKVQELSELLDEAAKDPKALRNIFAPKKGERVPMGDVFTSCNWMLRDGASHTSAKRLFLITDEDNPHPNNPQLLKTAQNTMFDLRQLGVLVQTFFISTHERPFKIAKFYSSVISGSAEDADTVEDVVTSFETLLSEMRFREAPKRALWSVPLHLGEDFTIGVKGYGLVTEQKRPVYSYRSNIGREQEEVKSRTVYVDEELELDIERGRVVYGMSLGATVDEEEEATGMTRAAKAHKKVFYTAEEVKEFRTLGIAPGIKLLGFKDLDQLAMEDSVKHSWFLYPDESLYSGSTRTFSALLHSMDEKKKMALVLGLFRSNSSPAFYAMIAQPERHDGVEPIPPGFHIIQLPFADDIRAATYEKAFRAEDKTTDAAVAWIEKLKIKNGTYNADDNPNPALQLHYAQLQALAFNEEFDADDIDDFTAPPTQIIKKRAGHLISEWKRVLNDDENAHQYIASETKSTSAKRKAEAASLSEAEIRARYDAGSIQKLTVEQIKEFLKSKGQSVGGKKADLVDRLGDWFDGHPE